jgi:hypothetical protein
VVVKKHILRTIRRLDDLYDPTSTDATYFSKLAIIELCGWIESTMDNIAGHFAKKKLKTQQYKDIFRGVKENNFGFDYKKNFRKMLIQTIGMHKMERIEQKLNKTGSISILDSTLDTLKSLRNDAAHNHIGVTTVYQAPSVTKSQLEIIYPILKSIGQEIKRVK